MNVSILLALLVLSVAGLWADSGEPIRLSVQRVWRGRLVPSPDDSGRVAIVYQRPAWDRASSTLTVRNASAGVHDFVDRLPELEVVDAQYWSGGILVVHRKDRQTFVRWVSDDGRSTQTADVAVPIPAGDTIVERGAMVARARVLIGADHKHALLIVMGHLFEVQRRSAGVVLRPIESDVLAAVPVSSSGGAGVVLAYRSGPSAFLALTDSSMRVVSSMLVPLADVVRIEQVGSAVMLFSSLEGAGGCIITVLDLATRTASTRSVPVDASHVAGMMIDGVRSLAILTTRTGRPEVVCVPVSLPIQDLPEGTIIPGDYGSPRLIRAFGDTIVAVFTGGIAAVAGSGAVLARDPMQLAVGDDAEILRVAGGFVVSGATQSALLYQHEQPLWFLARSWEWLLRYVIPMLFIASLVVLFLVYRRQRRFLEAMIDAPGAGLILFIDVNGRLLRVNERAAALLRITSDVPMGRMFSIYMNQPGLAQLSAFIERVRLSRESHSERISTALDDEIREVIVTSTPIVGTLGSSRGLLFTGVDITETLEQRRLTNWAQLAHDMQTNLSTIRLNAEQIHGDITRGDDERRRRILFQVGVLIDRVRDLLGVARSEIFQRSVVHSAELCTEVRHEFDATMFPHVTFSMKLRGTLMNADRLKLSRAVRNAVENAIKALRNQPGTVEISTWFDRTNVFISVSDTGVGMDPETMANMMKPYFSSSTDGSGHGIGTMIMHHVTKLHGGRIRVTSEPGKGTQVVFRIPHGMEPKEKIRASSTERAI